MSYITIMIVFLSLPIFITRLLIANLIFISKILLLKLKRFISLYFILILLYLLLFSQALLLLSRPQSNKKTIFFSEDGYQKTVEQYINLSRVNNYQITASPAALKQELQRYKSNHEREDQHRDILINQALLELSLGNEVAFKKALDQAKQLDPNWVGWQ